MNDFFGPLNNNLLGPLFGDKDYLPEPPEPGTGTAMNGYFGPLFDGLFGPLFTNLTADVEPEPEAEVTITGQVSADVNGYYNTFIIRQIPGVINVNNKQIIRRNRYITPNQTTGAWTASIPPTDYEFIFRSGQNAIREYKTVTVSANYEDLGDYSGII